MICQSTVNSREGKNMSLAFNSDIAKALKNDSLRDHDEATILSNAARIIRKDMFEMKNQAFTGNFL